MPPEMRPSKSLIATAIQNKHKESLFSLGCRRPAVSSCRYTVRGYTYAHVNIVGEQDRGSCRKKDRDVARSAPNAPRLRGSCPLPDPTEPTLSITMMAGKPDTVGAKSGQHRSPKRPLSIRPIRPIDHHVSIQAMYNRRVRMDLRGSGKRGPRLHKYSTLGFHATPS